MDVESAGEMVENAKEKKYFEQKNSSFLRFSPEVF